MKCKARKPIVATGPRCPRFGINGAERACRSVVGCMIGTCRRHRSKLTGQTAATLLSATALDLFQSMPKDKNMVQGQVLYLYPGGATRYYHFVAITQSRATITFGGCSSDLKTGRSISASVPCGDTCGW